MRRVAQDLDEIVTFKKNRISNSNREPRTIERYVIAKRLASTYLRGMRGPCGLVILYRIQIQVRFQEDRCQLEAMGLQNPTY